jgi:hypothetical protein
MTDKRLWFFAVVLFGGVLMASSAVAWTPADPLCIGDAKEEFKVCVSKCQAELKVDKDSCHQVDHQCAEKCREAFEKCVDVPLTQLAECKLHCNSLFEGTRDDCRASYSPGTWQRDKCIDHAQRVAFGCRDQCRENVQWDLTQCRKAFSVCIRACPDDSE